MPDPFPDDDRVRVAVVTGGHNFQVPQFHQLFCSMPHVDAYVQSIENWAADDAGVRASYDVVVFYTMHISDPPAPDLPWPEHRVREALESLGLVDQGLLVWHHALVSYPAWDVWSELTGIFDRQAFDVTHGVELSVSVSDDRHPITQGVEPFQIVDETYTLPEPGEGNRVLLTVDHAKSMRTVGWTRSLENSPVFCLQLGHDSAAWENDSFRHILERGIRWCAGRI